LSQASVDDDVFSGDVGRAVAGEEKYEVGDLFGCGEPFGRRIGDGSFRDGFRVGAARGSHFLACWNQLIDDGLPVRPTPVPDAARVDSSRERASYSPDRDNELGTQ